MNSEEIVQAYQDDEMGYDDAMEALIAQGLSEQDADDLLVPIKRK